MTFFKHKSYYFAEAVHLQGQIEEGLLKIENKEDKKVLPRKARLKDTSSKMLPWQDE